MTTHRQRCSLVFASALAAMAFVATGLAEPRIEIRNIEVNDNVYTPYYEARTILNHEQGADKKWIQVRVEYTTAGGWIDELAIDHAVLVEENGDVLQPVVLTGNATYINIKPGDHYATMYIHPSMVERYQLDSPEIDTAVVFHLNGITMESMETTKNAKAGWSKVTGMLKHKGHLLDPSETPFWFINYDFKEVIKPKRCDQHAR